MHCPKCGQQQVSEEIRYCSRCGFLLTGVATVVANDGILPDSAIVKGTKTKRKQGVKQAAFILILGIVLVPIWIAFLVATNGPEELAVAAVFLFLGSAILRAAYALFVPIDRSDRTACDSGKIRSPRIWRPDRITAANECSRRGLRRPRSRHVERHERTRPTPERNGYNN